MKQFQDEIRAFLGPEGAMLASSKSGYRNEHPNNLIIFNANVCFLEEEKTNFLSFFKKKSTTATKIWWGDFDLTSNRNGLKNLANAIGKTVILLFEMDARFGAESMPKWQNYLYMVTPDGDEKLGECIAYRVKIDDEEISIIPQDEMVEN